MHGIWMDWSDGGRRIQGHFPLSFSPHPAKKQVRGSEGGTSNKQNNKVFSPCGSILSLPPSPSPFPVPCLALPQTTICGGCVCVCVCVCMYSIVCVCAALRSTQIPPQPS
jgi:hypothetical protein